MVFRCSVKQYCFLNFIGQLYFASIYKYNFYIYICSKFISSNSCIDFLGISMYMIISFRNTISFPICRSFVLLALCSVEQIDYSRHPRLIINLKRKTFSLSPLSMMVAIGFSQMHLLSSSLLLKNLHNRRTLANGFSVANFSFLL